MSILVVDDKPANLSVLSQMLSREGYEVRVSLNGKFALQSCQILTPHLILLDIMMPEMDGYEVCQKLKENPQTRDIPVIFISALDDAFNKVKAFEVGGADYIIKPFEAIEVLARIKHQLKLRSLQCELQNRNESLQENVRQLRMMQANLIQNQTMSALMKVVAGIAHEINNPINFISGNINIAKQYIKDLLEFIEENQSNSTDLAFQELAEEYNLDFIIADLPKLLNSVTGGTNRIIDIIRRLQVFSRLDEAELKPVNLNDGLDSALMLLRHKLQATQNRSKIEVFTHYASLPNVTCYPRAINQVFLNILDNAIDAIDTKTETDRDRENDMEKERQNEKFWIEIVTELTDRETVKIVIADNGIGIEEAIASKIFEPFFTTKPIGQGVGLGLFSSYRTIIEQHQGVLDFGSTPGDRTEFIIEIPRTFIP
ncbi:MAG: response regulator [Cyanobacteria bacterium P01_E01_bin.42]